MAENDETTPLVLTPTVSNHDIGEDVHGEDLDPTATVPDDVEGQNENPDLAAPVPLSNDKTLDIQRLIDVMDHHLTCEAAWHRGHPAEQTVHTCIYVHNTPKSLPSHVLLHSFCKVAGSTVNDVAQVRKLEEDFFNVYNKPAKGDREILSTLQRVEETISRQLKKCKAPLSKQSLFEGVQPLQTNDVKEKEFCEAVLCRLRFRKYFYHVLTCLRTLEGNGFDLARKHIESCLKELQSMLGSEEFLRSSVTDLLGRAEHNKTTASGSQPVGFSNSSPRIELCSWKEAVDCFEKLLHDLMVICSNSLSPVLEDAVHFLIDFQKRKPLEFVTAYIQLLVGRANQLYGREPIFFIICKAALLPESANNHDVKERNSVKKLGELLIELLKVLCTDCETQRSELASKVTDWRRIHQQLETELRNKYGTPSSFSEQHQVCKHILLWVEEQQLWIALRYLLLGFETDAYSRNDYLMVYWYIYMITVNLAAKIMKKTELKEASVNQNARTRKRGSAPNVGEESEVPPQVILLKCYARVAEGLIAVLGVLRIKHKLFTWQGEEQMFSLNFSALKQYEGYWYGISYESFKECTSFSSFFNDDIQICFDKVHDFARQLTVKYEGDPARLCEVEKLQTVALCNKAAFNLSRKFDNLDESTTFSFEQHPHFASVTLGGPDIENAIHRLNINAP